MSPKKLRLKGFRGIKDGLGRDELVFDLEALAGDARLVCLAGPNGSGKTTIMENLHPYRLMPSRASGLSPATFSYYEHLSQPEAIKELEWRHQGALYRSILVLRMNGAKRRSEAYLHRRVDGEWQPVRLTDGTVSDGKADTYDRCVEALLGNAETFFTSVFSAQNRRSLSAYANGEIKALMVELLGLKRVREVGERVNEVARQLKFALEQARSALAGLPLIESEAQALRAESARVQHELERLESAIVQGRQQLAAVFAKLALLREQRTRSADAEKHRATLRAQRSEIDAAFERTKAALQADTRRELARRQRLQDRLAQLRMEAAQRKAQLDQELARAIALVQRQAEVDAAKVDSQGLAERERAVKGEIAALKQRANAQAELTRQRAVLANERDAIERETGAAVLRLEDFKKRCGLIAEVPCVDTDLQPRCKLLVDASAAHAYLPAVQGDLGRLRSASRQVRLELNRLDTQLQADGEVQTALRQAESCLETLLAQRRIAEATAALAPAVRAAAARATQLREEIDAFERSASKETEKLLTETHEAAKVADALNVRLQDECQRQQGQLARLQAQLDALPAPFDHAALEQTQLEVGGTEEQVATQENLRLAAIAQQASVEAQLQERVRRIAEGAVHQARAARLSTELGWWNLLGKAFGNDGIIALCIDDAGPGLSALANDLLLACYGPRFTVSIRTQVETAKKEVREGFEIVVFDTQSEQAKTLAAMSGGERVWIQEALTRAIALYLSGASARGFETLFSDEADGALDPDRKRMFMAMKREVLRLGGYQREIFVTQTPELATLAEVVIDVHALSDQQISPVRSMGASG